MQRQSAEQSSLTPGQVSLKARAWEVIAGPELSSLGMISPVVFSQRSGSFVLNCGYDDRNNDPVPLIDTKSRRGLSADLEMAGVYF